MPVATPPTPSPSRSNTKPTDIPRPSPWHSLSHSLSNSSILSNPNSNSSFKSTPHSHSHTSSTLSPSSSTTSLHPQWPLDPSATRHHISSPSLRVAAESDKEGFIEYKLKLINPSAERFERLVTQMLWRLKQGKNEAIYEIGLADDGTVIGLTREEMDASLSTLEQMASEVGATVLILKEIILTGVKRPDRFAKCWLNDQGAVRVGGRRDREGDKWDEGTQGLVGQNGRARQYVFDEEELVERLEGVAVGVDEDDGPGLDGGDRGDEGDEGDEGYGKDKGDDGDGDENEEVPTFHMDMEDSPVPIPSAGKKAKWKKIKKTPSISAKKEDEEEKKRKAEAKRAKAAGKREARRLDLLRGDGMSPPIHEYNQFGIIPLGDIPAPRTSSLRLAPTVPDPDTDLDEADSQLMNDLLHLPLDSLSLSFADVQTIRARSPSILSSSSSTEYAPDVAEEEGEEGEYEELLCVEALVVRKVNHEEEEMVDGAEDAWGFGGGEEEDISWSGGGDLGNETALIDEY